MFSTVYPAMKSDNQYGPIHQFVDPKRTRRDLLGPEAEFDLSLLAIDSRKEVSVGGCWGSDGSVLNRLKRPLSGKEINVPFS